MSNVQEALNEAFEALLPFADCLQYIEIDEDDEEWAKFRLLIKNYRQAATAYEKCKAALSKIEKCEPELYMAKNLHNKSYATSRSEAEARLFLLQSGLKVDRVESEVIPLCRCGTSPQHRDWVWLSDDELLAIAEIDAADHWYFEVCKRVSEKLKQLNTKG